MQKLLPLILRLLLGALFVFSGLVKAVDPWGTALKMGEYLAAMGIDGLRWAVMPAAVAMPAVEFALGVALLAGLCRRFTSLAVVIFMAFFTLLTLYTAAVAPIGDCGCFGDAVKLGPWQTFAKNLIMLPMSIVVWRRSTSVRGRQCRWGIAAVCLALTAGSLPGFYALRHLPIVDFLPYKVGVDLREARTEALERDNHTTLIYRNLQTGREQEFELGDTTWHDDTLWEYVDTHTESRTTGDRNAAANFALFDRGMEVTELILDSESPVTLLCITDPERLEGHCRERLARAAALYHTVGCLVVCATPAELPSGQEASLQLNGESFPCYNIDGTLLKELLRARNGLVRIDQGVITLKHNCLDM